MKRTVMYALAAITALIVIAPLPLIRFDVPVETLKARYADGDSRFMDLDGMKVHYRDRGQGFPVVLVHGTSSSLHTWEGWTGKLAKKYRVIRMDLPAFGLTGPSPAGDYTIAAYVRFLDAFLARLEIERFHLAGNSLGGLICWNYAIAHPGKVGRLILIDAAGYPRKNTPALFRLARTAPFRLIGRYVTPRFLIERNLREVYGDDSKITDALVERYHDMALREGNRRAFIARVLAPNDFEENLRKLGTIKSPALIMWGRDDAWIPVENAYHFKRDIPGSRLAIYEGIGHVPMEEIPARSVRDAAEFLAR